MVSFESIHAYTSIPWSQIPDLGLYMDQVITLIGQACQPLYGPDIKSFISPTMINNYVKAKLLPRPTGKKYSREQIALIYMIVILKQVCSMEDIRVLLTPPEGGSIEDLYNAFCGRFTQALETMQSRSPEGLTAAMDFAIQAAGYRVGCSAALGGRDI